jgi:hypothetical protein
LHPSALATTELHLAARLDRFDRFDGVHVTDAFGNRIELMRPTA